MNRDNHLEQSPLDAFIPAPDVRERFQTRVRAPAPLVMEVATNFDLQSLATVRTIFWLRERLMRAPRGTPRKRQGLLADTRDMGWQVLLERPGSVVVCGAACQPWTADTPFTPIPPERFAEFAEPDQVKIAWSFEAVPLGDSKCSLIHETRVVATDEAARVKFKRYWRWARYGIIAIRLLILPAVRRTAERQYKAG